MSEYIIDCTPKMATDLRGYRRGQIVRCKDCEHYELDPDPIDPGWPMRCADCGRDMLEPDGYCAWGKRRDV